MSTHSRIIIIVDDDPELRTLARKILQTAGFQTLEAADLKSLSQLLDQHLPHLILLDLNLGPEDGLEFLRRRKERQPWQNIPVVVLSGRNDAASQQEALALGANHFLPKPFKAALLLQKVNKYVKGTKQIRYDFPERKRPKINSEIHGIVSALNDEEAWVHFPVRFNLETPIEIQGSLFSQLSITKLLIMIPSRLSEILTNGLFGQKAKLMGLSETQMKSLANLTKVWK